MINGGKYAGILPGVSMPPSAGGALDPGVGWVPLDEQIAYNSTYLDFVRRIDSTFDVYVFQVITLMPGTNRAALQGLLSNNHGGVWLTAASAYANAGKAINGAGTSLDYGGAATSAARLSEPTDGISSTPNAGGYSGHIQLFQPSAPINHLLTYQATQADGNAGTIAMMTGSVIKTQNTVPVNAMRFQLSAGVIVSGRIRLFGVRF